MNPIYLVIAGYVTNRENRHINYLSEDKLIELYGVQADQCVRHSDPSTAERDTSGLIELRPRESGDYSLPS